MAPMEPAPAADSNVDVTVTVLVHRTCRHVGALVNHSDERRRLEDIKQALHAAGYYQWRVQTEPLTDDLVARQLEGPCDTCRIDPSRMSMAGQRAAAELAAGRGLL